MSYTPGSKGLLTETNAQDAGEMSLKDAVNVVVTQQGKIEARHGLNQVTRFVNFKKSLFNFSPAMSVYKIPYNVSPYNWQYVVVGAISGDNFITSIPVTDNLHENSAITPPSNIAVGITNNKKPVFFNFGELCYIVTDNGWYQRTINSSPSQNFTYINWPSFQNIVPSAIQDEFDFGKNWLSNNKKVGIKVTYVWTIKDNLTGDEQEIESAPSQIYTVLHPVSLNTYTGNIPTAEFSKIKVNIGWNKLNLNNNASFLNNFSNTHSIRVYRTKQVDIDQPLPTDYRQAAPDFLISSWYPALNATSGATNDTVATDFPLYLPSASPFIQNAYKPGMAIVFYPSDILNTNFFNVIVPNKVYYLGNPGSSTGKWQIIKTPYSINNPLVRNSVTGGNVDTLGHMLIPEIDLTVNDEALLVLPQLYTNPNVEGEEGYHMLPPIAKHVLEYKNYTLAADYAEPLRAFFTLVKQPFVKTVPLQTQIEFIDSTNAVCRPRFANVNDGVEIVSNTCLIDSALHYPVNPEYPAVTEPIVVSSGQITNNNIPLSMSFNSSPMTTNSINYTGTFFAHTEYVEYQVTLKDNTTETFSAKLLPEYNRCGPYPKRLKSSTSEFYDAEFEWLQYGGYLKENNKRTPYALLPSNEVPVVVYMPPAVPGSIQRGKIPAPIYDAANAITIGAASVLPSGASARTLTFTLNRQDTFDIKKFQSPGILVGVDYLGYAKIIMSYKSFTNKTSGNAVSVEFSEIEINYFSNSNDFSIAVSGLTAVYYVPGSSFSTLPLYYIRQPLQNWNPDLLDYQTFNIVTISNSEVYIPPIPVSLLPANGFPSIEIGNVNNSPNTQGTISYLTNVQFYPVSARSPAELLDLATEKLVQRLNNAKTSTDIQFFKGKEPGQFYVEVYGGKQIIARHTGSSQTAQFEPNITGNFFVEAAKFKGNKINTVALSKNGQPVSFPASRFLAPLVMGSDKKSIMSLIKNSDDCFVLKEDGIWSIRISSSSPTPLIDAVVQIDTTTSVVTPYTAKEINEEIIFLSQKGFMSITGTTIENISREIETEVKTALQQAINANLGWWARAWVNEQKRIYGCTIWTSTNSFVTYVFNTFTRQWTKWDVPVIDATTDNQGRTAYLLASKRGTAPGNNFVNDPTFGTTAFTNYTFSKWILTEEKHTNGLDRNENDQWDFYFKPSAIALSVSPSSIDGNQLYVCSASTSGGGTFGPDPICSLYDFNPGDVNYAIGASQFVNQPAYFKYNGTLYPITFYSLGDSNIVFYFKNNPSGIVPKTLTGDEGFYLGVQSIVTYNPTGTGTPDTNKQFSEYHVHLEEAVSTLVLNFSTDSRSSFTSDRTYAYNASAVNRTVFRTFIPVEASRGRWFIRKITHSVPAERLVITGQTHVIRDTMSKRVQKAPR